jgi:hypothetical protein
MADIADTTTTTADWLVADSIVDSIAAGNNNRTLTAS